MPPNTSTDRYAFPTAVEGIVKGLGPLITEQTKDKLKRSGLDIDRLPPAIPADDMANFIRVLAGDVFPNVPLDEGLRLVGLHFVRGWKNTLLGAAGSAILRLIGPHRYLMKVDRGLRTSNNFTNASTEFVGTNEAIISLSDVNNIEPYWLGVFQGGLEYMGFPNGVASLHASLSPGAKFHLRW